MHNGGYQKTGATMKTIKSVRKSLGETQDKFGKRLGVNQATICRWELKGIPEEGPARYAIEQLLRDLRRRN
jgi:DNA-binding transcriptional regulator YiaG